MDAVREKNAIDVLRDMDACNDGIDEVRVARSFRAAWDSSTSRANMMWLICALHRRDKITHRRLVRVAVRCVETCAHVLPEAARPLLADVSAWWDGDESNGLLAVLRALRTIRQKAWGAEAEAEAAAYAEAAAAVAAAVAAVVVAAVAAAEAAAEAAVEAAAVAAVEAAMCDVIRDEIDADEVAAAMGIDADEVLS